MEFISMVRLTQKTLKKRVAGALEELGYPVQVQKGFVYAPGEIPVLLVAHLDTVHTRCVKTLRYTADRTLVSSPEGIGGDDRCGVYIILQVARLHKCHVLFCEDEEIGSLGAKAFAEAGIQPAVNYIVSLDRSGAADAVFYECDNPAFTKFVCGFGFAQEEGTRSDISVLAPHLGIAGVNLSAGYYRQHKTNEYVNLEEMRDITHRVCSMVQTETGPFEYIRRPPPVYSWNTGNQSLFEQLMQQKRAGEQRLANETPVADPVFCDDEK